MVDIGCHNGYFMDKFLREGGAEALGVEPNEELRQFVQQCGMKVAADISQVQGKFDFCLYLDLHYHDGIDYLDWCLEHAKTVFIAPSGDGNATSVRLFNELSEKVGRFSAVLRTPYANRMIFKCQGN